MSSVLFITNYPAPYRVAFFRMLGSSVDLTVAFSERPEQQLHRSSSWFDNNYNGFHAVFLDGGRADENTAGSKQNRNGKPGITSKCLQLMQVFRQHYDVIILGGYAERLQMFAVQYLTWKKIPFYLEVDGGLISPDNTLKYWVKKHLISRASGYLSSGKAASDYLVHYGAAADRIFTYTFSSLTEEYVGALFQETGRGAPAREIVRQKARTCLGIPQGNILLAVGQMIPRKGIDILLRAFQKLPEDYYLYIVGGAPAGEYLALAGENSRILFPGFKSQKELRDYYFAADLFVHPCREDIWGLVVNEAMANALPVVTTDRCGAGLTLIKNGENGFIVPVEDADGLAEGIMKVFCQGAPQMGLQAYNDVRDCTIETMVKDHLDIIDRITYSSNE